MDLDCLVNRALSLFPYDEAYPQQKEFIKAMLNALSQRKIGILESPTGTVQAIEIRFQFICFLNRERRRVCCVLRWLGN